MTYPLPDHIPPGSAVVTPTEMLGSINNLAREVHSLQGPIERVGKVLDDHETRIRDLEQREDGSGDVADLELRVRDLERWRWSVGSLLTIGGGVVGAIVSKWTGG